MKKRIARGIVKARIALLALFLICAGLAVPAIGRTTINYDLNRYLSEETMTRRALEVMEAEFGSTEQLRMMFSGLSEDQLTEILAALNAREEVLLAAHDPEGGVQEIDGKRYLLVSLTLNECDASQLVRDLRAAYPDALVGGSAATQLDVQNSVAGEMPGVMGIAVAVVLAVLLLTSHAWLEPLVILITLGVSILLNMGTNFLFADVSFITFAVSAILQLALSIDYAIMLLHTWNDLRDAGRDGESAMVTALSGCFMRIGSSALTTVAGLLSLLFMSFTIGFDIGMVLSKGIVISMLSVFLLMPALTLLLEKPLTKTRHNPLRLGGEKWGGFVYRARRPLAIALVALVLLGAYLNTQCTYSFTESSGVTGSESMQINEVFGVSNPLVALVPGGMEEEEVTRQRELAERLSALKDEDGQPLIPEITAMVTTGAAALEEYTAADVAELIGQSELLVRLFYTSQGFGDSVRADRLLASAESIMGDNPEIQALQAQLAAAREAFLGEHYSRMMLSLSFNALEPGFMEKMDRILETIDAVYPEGAYITGVPMSTYDIANAFQGDLLKVNLITLLAILLIVVLSFRAAVLPLLLVFVIEGAIWLTMGISTLTGQPIFFISYLICLSMQMGATIDYGILLSDQYRSLRREGLEPKGALQEALRRALPTICTSGIILVTAGYIIGKLCSIYYISSIGLLISRGALISALLVLSLLPALLVTVNERLGKKA